MADVSGATVVFPPGALTTDTTIRVAMDSTGAPPVPAGLGAAGNVYVITPHGGGFAQPVTVSIPAPNVTLQPNQELRLAKAQPGGQWTLLDTTVADGKLKANVDSFSFFMSVVVTYPLPILQSVPFNFDTTVTCGGSTDCTWLVGPTEMVFTLRGNGGQFPPNCVNPTARMTETTADGNGINSVIPLSGYVHRRTVLPDLYGGYKVYVDLDCTGFFRGSWRASAFWNRGPGYPKVSVIRAPAQLDVVDGTSATLDVLMGGGAVKPFGPGNSYTEPTVDDHAIVDWQRSDDAGASWRTIARSFQHEQNPLPYGTGARWQPWSVRHAFTVNATDQNALIRVYACYTPPAVAPPPCVTGTPTRINVLQQGSAPEILANPRAMLIRSAETANFSVTVAGQPVPTLQWQTRPANSTGAWTDVAAGVGATTANYTTGPRALSNNGEQYRVVATNAVGSAASTPVTVSVSDVDVAPSITTQPASLSVTTGNDAVFAIDAFGTEALSYQWRRNGADIPGANSAVLRLAGVSSANEGSYTVRVTNAAGAATSNAATLSVTAGLPAAVAPTIVTQPSAVTVNAGSTATFAVGVDGSGPFTFQWRREGANISGATSAVYSLNPAQLLHAGMYSVVVSNSAGTIVSASAMLDVAPAVTGVAPTITTQPATVILPLGGSGIMAVGATGSGPLSYQWFQDGIAIPFATQPVLNLFEIAANFAGTYTVTVSNASGTRTSAPAQLILLGAPVITEEPAPISVFENGTASFNVTASGSNLSYQWLLNGAPIPGADQSTYVTPNLVTANSGGVYRVIVSNGAGLVFSQSAVLTVQAMVAPTAQQHPANATIPPGAQAQLCVRFGGTPPFTGVIQRWTGSWVQDGPAFQITDNSVNCVVTSALQLADSGALFRVVASNALDSANTNPATITVQAPPPAGVTALVSVAVGGTPANNVSNEPSMSADGRYVAFISQGTDLHPDATGTGHAYVRDTLTDTTRLIDYNRDGDEPSQGVFNVKLSADGRYALFSSRANDLVQDDTNNAPDVFRRDLQTGTTLRVSTMPNGDELPFGVGGNGDYQLGISADGRVVTFLCAYDIATGGNGAANSNYFLYIRDLQSGFVREVAGTSEYQVYYSALSDSGEYVAYAYGVPAPANQAIYLYDFEADQESLLLNITQAGNPSSLYQGMSISANGRYTAVTLLSQDIFGAPFTQVAVLDRSDPGAVIVASRNSGVLGNANSAWPRISGDGRYVAYSTLAPNLTNGEASAFAPILMVADIQEGISTIASRRTNGTSLITGTFLNQEHAISRDGSRIAFVTSYDAALGNGVPTFGNQVFTAPRP